MNYCCVNCFNQSDIADYIRGCRQFGNCDYCGTQNIEVISTKKAGEYIRSCLDKAYEPLEEGTGAWYDSEEKQYVGINGTRTGISVREIIVDEEAIFSHRTDADELFVDLFADSGISDRDDRNGGCDRYADVEMDNFVRRNDLFQSESTKEYSEWESFKYTVKYYNRFFDINPKGKRRMERLDTLKPYFEKMAQQVKRGEVFYRVRKMDRASAENPGGMDLYKEMAPAPVEFAVSNRMSPAGISYLYVAGQPETAYEECRLQGGDCAFMAKFVAKCELNILDLSQKVNSCWCESIFSKNYNHDMLWINDFLNQFEDEISRPIDPNKDKSYEYAATQIVAEYVRFLGYDGIKYRSSVSDSGINYVFFCGPNKDISGQSYEEGICPFPECELRAFTDWFRIAEVKAVEIRDAREGNVRSLDINSVSEIQRSDISAENVFHRWGGHFTYNSLDDISRFIKEMPEELSKEGYGKEVAEDIIDRLTESLGTDGKVHHFWSQTGFQYLGIHIDEKEYKYVNHKGKDFF